MTPLKKQAEAIKKIKELIKKCDEVYIKMIKKGQK